MAFAAGSECCREEYNSMLLHPKGSYQLLLSTFGADFNNGFTKSPFFFKCVHLAIFTYTHVLPDEEV